MAKKKQNGKVLDLLKTLEPGDSFYTETDSKTAFTYAFNAGVKVTTSNILVVEEITKDKPVVKKIVKVTLI